ncbi:MAG: hydantoinase/oxoprolinase family protein, partial [Mahellales bacterium]
MRLGLGIDTGGTYTDAVIYDFDKEEVLDGNKALTTKEDLNIGINEVLSKFSDDMLAKVQLVSLSTTLATNACVENKGGRGLLILMGYDHDILREYGHKYGLPLGNGDIVLVSGSHSQTGEVVQQPDWDRLREIVEEYKDKIDAFGIAEYWGIRNPEFEKQAKKLIMDTTGLPVVCAHELSGEINSLRRAASTLLNARLIPLTDGLMKAVKKSLQQRSIKAPLMIVRGDGSLMSEGFAKEKPVETLLSGPAASVVGGMKLSGTNECIILDMGGTTSDLAIVRDGRVTLAEEGVDIGEWRTATQAIEVKTMGLGGDSLISFDKFE